MCWGEQHFNDQFMSRRTAEAKRESNQYALKIPKPHSAWVKQTPSNLMTVLFTHSCTIKTLKHVKSSAVDMPAVPVQCLEINLQNQANGSVTNKLKGTKEKQEEPPQEKCIIASPPDNGLCKCVRKATVNLCRLPQQSVFWSMIACVNVSVGYWFLGWLLCSGFICLTPWQARPLNVWLKFNWLF